MKKSQKYLNKHLRKNPIKLIVLAGLLAIISVLFVGACLYKIYESAYTTSLRCDQFVCKIIKQDFLGGKTEQYAFNPYDLKLIALEKQKNILGQEVYYLTIADKENNDIKYLLTGETTTETEQSVYLEQINKYINANFNGALDLSNHRYKAKFIGFAAAGAGSLVALMLILDCIKGILDFKKKSQKSKSPDYKEVLQSRGHF
ncbi:MAG TPA: hypothetical protein P5556_06765 [Candidatus Gastranaerophilales bacterium]|nr:hypothetical protein [Candidatus Gastranaerophilales bacterium]